MNCRWTKAALATMAFAALGLGGCTTLRPDTSQAASSPEPVWSAAMETQRLGLIRALRKSGVSAVRNKDNQLQFNLPSDFAFAPDSAEIVADMRDDLDELATSLNNPSVRHMRLLVVGYTDNQGSELVNDPLSLARAHAVAQHIQSKGVDANRITVEGRGERQPMVSNDQSYGRALNRRVEIVLTEPAEPASASAPQ